MPYYFSKVVDTIHIPTSCGLIFPLFHIPTNSVIFGIICLVAQSSPMDCSLPCSSVHVILQARILEWIANPSSRGCSQPRDQTCTSCVSCIGRQVLNQLSHQGSPCVYIRPLEIFPQPSDVLFIYLSLFPHVSFELSIIASSNLSFIYSAV